MFGATNHAVGERQKDEIKRQFCKKNGIRELEISYLDFSNIEKILEEEIVNG